MRTALPLSKGLDRGYTLGQFEDQEQARSFVQRVIALGAVCVEVVDNHPHPESGCDHSNQLLVELPDEQAQRAALFAWGRSVGHEPGEDAGQRFLLVRLART